MTLTALSPDAVQALRDIEAHGTEQDRARALALLAEHGLVDDPDTDLRRQIRDGGPMVLGELVMPDTITGARSPLHDELNAFHLREAAGVPGQRVAVAAPRGHGKSTAGVEVAAIWQAAHCARRFQVIISDSDDQAIARLAAIKAHAEENETLQRLYPKLRPAYPRLTNDPTGATDLEGKGPWRERDVVFACGCRISARGAGTRMRGMKHRERRPDLLYLDDLEDETSVSTADQLAKRLRWLQRVALGLAGPMVGMSVLWVGTILSRDALINKATGAAMDDGQQRPAWASSWIPRVFRAEVPGTPKIPTTATVTDPDTGAAFDVTYDVGEPLWSELTRTDLARIRGELGDASYAAEYLNDPVDGSGGMIAAPVPVSFVNPDSPPLSRVVRLPTGAVVPVGSMIRAAALDPAFSDDQGSGDPDYAAIAVIGLVGPNAFILDSWVGRDKDGQAARFVTMGQAWGVPVGAVESTAAQVVVADQAAQLARFPVRRMRPTEGKSVRAIKLSVYAQQGRLFLVPGGSNDRLPGFLTAFPNGRYDDPVDAVVMALDVATTSVPVGGGSGPAVGGVRITR